VEKRIVKNVLKRTVALNAPDQGQAGIADEKTKKTENARESMSSARLQTQTISYEMI